MDADERRRMEAAMAKISKDRKEVEADPAAAMQASLAPTLALAKRRLLLLLVALAVAAAIGIALYYQSHAAGRLNVTPDAQRAIDKARRQ